MEERQPGYLEQAGLVGLASVALALVAQSACCNIGYSTSTVTEVDGHVVESESHGVNYGALILGPVAILLSLAALGLALRGAADLRTGRLIIAAAGTIFAIHGLWTAVW